MELTLDMIETLVSESRTRGAYLPVIKTFFESGDIAINMTDKFPGKEKGNLRNVTTQNVDKYNKALETPVAFKVVVDKQDNVLLINLDALAVAKQAQA